MRTLIAATAISALLIAPAFVPAHAQSGQKQQETTAQSDLATSVKAKHPTHKRRQIIRSETGPTNGMGR